MIMLLELKNTKIHWLIVFITFPASGFNFFLFFAHYSSKRVSTRKAERFLSNDKVKSLLSREMETKHCSATYRDHIKIFLSPFYFIFMCPRTTQIGLNKSYIISLYARHTYISLISWQTYKDFFEWKFSIEICQQWW